MLSATAKIGLKKFLETCLSIRIWDAIIWTCWCTVAYKLDFLLDLNVFHDMLFRASQDDVISSDRVLFCAKVVDFPGRDGEFPAALQGDETEGHQSRVYY